MVGNLGRAELKIGKYRDAAEHLAYFLAEEKGLSPADKDEYGRQLQEAKANVATIRVEVVQAGGARAEGVDVTVGGVSMGKTPIEREIFVDPGHVIVEAKLGELGRKREFDARAGGNETVKLDLTPQTAPPPSQTVTTPPPPPPRPGGTGSESNARSYVPAYVLGGVGVAGLIAGAISLAIYADKKNQAFVLADQALKKGSHCTGSNVVPECTTIDSTAQSADLFRGAGTTLLISGGIIAAAAAAYRFWPLSAANGRGKRGDVGLAISPQGSVVVITGEF
jgi:hypothetical protein